MKRNQPSSACILCSSTRPEYEFMIGGYPLYHCRDCDLMFLDTSENPSVETGARFYESGKETAGEYEREALLSDNARGYIERIEKYRGVSGGTLLEIGVEEGSFLKAAQDAGYRASGLADSESIAAEINSAAGEEIVETGSIDTFTSVAEKFDICVIRNGVQRHENPVEFLLGIRRFLKEDGVLFFTIPSLDSRAARVMRQSWPRFTIKNKVYFNGRTIQTALFRAEFHDVHVEPERTFETLSNISKKTETFDLPFLFRLLLKLKIIIPNFIKKRKFPAALSGASVFCRPEGRRERPVLSVVMPVFNEKKTFGQVMDELIRKKLDGIDKEIVLVESNSTDGTREEVLKYKDLPGVKIVFEDRPRGKGHAVRTGLQNISGDFVLIQDGDLEYDINDYDILLEPLTAGRTAFVLGTRHSKGWKIRQFQESFLADFMNFGHRILVILMNSMYKQKMTDPFTMYKVFRRDCLYGLEFECDRFNFDIELVCKLLRKGYVPREIPINYRSRSFSEGKKVKIFQDPPTWIKAILKYRFTNVYNPFRNSP